MAFFVYIKEPYLYKIIKEFADWLIQRLDAKLIGNLNAIPSDGPHTIVVFQGIGDALSLIDKHRIIFFSVEQSTARGWRHVTSNNVNLLKSNDRFKAVDYSPENIAFYVRHYDMSSDRMSLIEPFYLGLHHNEPKNINITTLAESSYRREVYNNHLKQIEHVGIRNFAGSYHQSRQDILKHSKILVNIHADQDYIIAESFRIHEAIACRCIVVSQKCYREDLVTLSDYIYFEDDENLASRCMQILDNYEEEYARIYGDKTDQKVFKHILEHNEEVLDSILT